MIGRLQVMQNRITLTTTVEAAMAARKQFIKRSQPNAALTQVLLEARDRVVTEAELAEQRISFAFGNAEERIEITKDTVRAASTRTKLFA